VRVTVNELLSLPSGERLDRPEPLPPVVDAETYLTLVAVANALGELVARANAECGTRPSRNERDLRAGARGGRRDPGGDRRCDGARPAGPVIAVIRKGTSFGHAAAYLFGPGERGEHVDAHVVAGGNVLLGGPRRRDWVADMRFCAGLRPGVSRPDWHCLLRAAPQDRLLGDPGWAMVAGELVAALGLARHPCVAVRHGGNDVHVLAGRVDAYGEVWRDSRDYARTMAAVRVIERDHGLVAVHGPGRRTALNDGRAQSRG